MTRKQMVVTWFLKKPRPTFAGISHLARRKRAIDQGVLHLHTARSCNDRLNLDFVTFCGIRLNSEAESSEYVARCLPLVVRLEFRLNPDAHRFPCTGSSDNQDANTIDGNPMN